MAQHNGHRFDEMAEFISVRTVPGGIGYLDEWLRSETSIGGPMISAVYAYVDPCGTMAPLDKKVRVLVQRSRNGNVVAHPLLVMAYVGQQSPTALIEIMGHSAGFMPSLDHDRLVGISKHNIKLTRDLAEAIRAHNTYRDRATAEIERLRGTLAAAQYELAERHHRPIRRSSINVEEVQHYTLWQKICRACRACRCPMGPKS